MKKRQKSPTKNDIVKVVDALIYDVGWVQRKIDGLTFAFNSYVEMKKDTKKFNSVIEKKINQEKDKVESTRNISKDS